MRILVVEDEQKIASDIARALEASGYIPDIVGDGARGLVSRRYGRLLRGHS